jgi:hypothetical protein
MVSVSVPGMYGWGNPSSHLPGVLGSSPYHRSGLGAPFFVGTPRLFRPLLCHKAVEEDIRTRVSVISTFFSNGRPLVSAQPLPTFVRVLQEEWARAP